MKINENADEIEKLSILYFLFDGIKLHSFICSNISICVYVLVFQTVYASQIV